MPSVYIEGGSVVTVPIELQILINNGKGTRETKELRSCCLLLRMIGYSQREDLNVRASLSNAWPLACVRCAPPYVDWA